MTTHKIALLAGDGIGPEIMAEAVKILKLVEQRHKVSFDLRPAPFGACAWFETRGFSSVSCLRPPWLA